MRKKIVFVDQCLGGGGAERTLITIMRSLNVDDFELHLVVVRELGDLGFLVPSNVVVHELGVAKTSRAFFPFVRKIWQLKPDIVFSSLHRITMLSLLARFFAGKYSVLARVPSMPSREIAGGSMAGWRRLLYKVCYRFADVVISQTSEMAEEISQVLAVPREKIITIANPLDVDLMDANRMACTSPFEGDFVNIVACGTLKKAKGYDFLLESFASVAVKNTKLRLYILGNDVEGVLPELEALSKHLGISDVVSFLGHVDNPHQYFTYCDLYVLSSRWEGFPNSLVEAIYCGASVVATKCVPVIEEIISRNGGIAVDFGDVEKMAGAIESSESIVMTPSLSNESVEEFARLLRRS